MSKINKKLNARDCVGCYHMEIYYDVDIIDKLEELTQTREQSMPKNPYLIVCQINGDYNLCSGCPRELHDE